LGRFENFGTWFTQFFKINKRWKFYMWWIYLKKKIFFKKHEKWEIVLKNEAIGDFLYENLGEERKWYEKR
jgi:hypothetical protein